MITKETLKEVTADHLFKMIKVRDANNNEWQVREYRGRTACGEYFCANEKHADYLNAFLQAKPLDNELATLP